MGKKKLSIISCAITLTFMSLTIVSEAFTQDLKVGYIDPRVILQRMPEAKAVQQQIQNLYDRKQNEIVSMQQELQSQIEQYQQKAGVISEESQLIEEERLTQMDLDLRELQSAAQQEIQQESAKLMEPIFEQIQLAVDNVSEERGLDLILNMTMGGYSVLERNILYVSPENQRGQNITSAVMQDLGI